MLLLASFTSCIKDEPLNMEADIESVVFDENNRGVLLFTTDSVLDVSSDAAGKNISVVKNPQADVTNVAPRFRLSSGASIIHVKSGKDGQGLALDFTEPQQYEVISQDGKWSREYTLSFDNPTIFTDFEFEHSEMMSGDRYVGYYELADNSFKRYYIWGTGNPGFAMSGGKDYPTQKYDRGYSNNGVLLKTVTTGMFGAALNMPIAAGNLFFGSFDSENAVTKPLAATKFGTPFNKKPLRFTGYYMYKPGALVTDMNNQPVNGISDKPDIYIVLYENTGMIDGQMHSIMLDGNNILSAEYIVGRARIGDNYTVSTSEQISKGEWNHFDLEFKIDEGKQIDPVRLANFGYNLAMVFTSSIDGAFFRGAVGSELYIDSVKLICEEN